MRSNLAELDGLVGNFIANENAAPTIDTAAFTKQIAGFSVIDPEMATKGEDIRRKQVTDYLTARERMRVLLQSKKVEPLAILPAKAWHQICEATGLYRFRTNQDGTVGATIDDLNYFMNFGVAAAWTFWVMIPVAVLTAAVVSNQWQHPSAGNVMAVIGCILLGIMYIIMANRKPTPFLRSVGFFARLGSRILDILPHSWLARRLIPNRVYYSNNNNYEPHAAHRTRVNLLLPAPPDSVAETLYRVQGMNGLTTAIVEDGFRFAERPSSLYRDSIGQTVALRQIDRENKREERRASWRAWAEKDPIIYIENEGCVAIVAQFGEFPIEREVVEAVCSNAAYLL